MKNQTAGKAWFDLPAPPESELPRLYREVEALRLHKQLDPKQFYRKEPGEGKGIKGLPKHFAVRLCLLFSFTVPSIVSASDRRRRRFVCADRHDHPVEFTLWRPERGQPAAHRAQTHARRRTRGRRRGAELREEEVQGAPDRARREGAGHARREAGVAETEVVVSTLDFWYIGAAMRSGTRLRRSAHLESPSYYIPCAGVHPSLNPHQAATQADYPSATHRDGKEDVLMRTGTVSLRYIAKTHE